VWQAGRVVDSTGAGIRGRWHWARSAVSGMVSSLVSGVECDWEAESIRDSRREGDNGTNSSRLRRETFLVSVILMWLAPMIIGVSCIKTTDTN
jgi:hypothetical protein